MPRGDAKLRDLERENDLLKKQLHRMHRNPDDIPFVACDNSCIIARPTGMATNGGCRCDEHRLRRAVMWWRSKAQFLLETINTLRGTYTLCPHFYDADDKLCELPVGHLGVHGTIDNVLLSHDKWRNRADRLQTALKDVLQGRSPSPVRSEEIKNLSEGNWGRE